MQTAPSLPELQQRFVAALYADGDGDLDASVTGHGLDPAARLRIYRHSCNEIQANALRTVYPAVLALVGEAYFDQTARGYRVAYPSKSGNLQDFGAHFATYLETLPVLEATGYLPDVARLEWLRQESALAADAAPLAHHSSVVIDGLDRIDVHPGVRLLTSPHPVLTIWRYALAPAPENLVLDGAGENAVLWRDDGELAMATLDAASFACIAALADGGTFNHACASARARDAAFDPAACIDSFIQCGLIAAIVPAPTTFKESCP